MDGRYRQIKEVICRGMIDLGLKASTAASQIKDRLQYHPDVFEFYTNENDFTSEGLKRLKYDIQWVKSEATGKIVLHHPMKYQGYATEIIAPEHECPQLYSFIERSTLDLLQLAYDNDIQVLIHGAYARQTKDFIAMYHSFADAEAAAFDRLDHFQKLGDQHVMFENSLAQLFAYGCPVDEEKIAAHNYRLAFDTSHCFIKTNGSNKALMKSLINLKQQIVHYHLVDSFGKTHDSLPVGQGKINWQQVVPLLNPQATNIFEIKLTNEEDATEQVASYQYLKEIES